MPGQRQEHKEAGMTLTELMVTVAIIGVLAAAIGQGLARTDNQGAMDLFSRRLLIGLRQARNTALDTRSVVCVTFRTDGKAFTIDRASVPGNATFVAGTCPTLPASGVWLRLADVIGSGDAQINTVSQGALAAKVALPVAAPNGFIIFTPDGTVANSAGNRTGFTVFLQDRNAIYQSKVLVFGTTGYAYQMGKW
ncbi:MAG: prepilin-type N-terminal cleavage/methylation domain-containing protein [Deltaproteobacteria bacterium]|nr:prepilin-type N-terminal cleavage/methylation domain-containing protein [Deltaproteobacteria bacterium]